MEKEVVCGKENIKEFRQTLKTMFPEFYPVIKSLYDVGMIDGLRGAKISPLPKDTTNMKKTPQREKLTQYCKDCYFWHKDFIGDGTGAGQCELKIRPSTSKYPKTQACDHYKAEK